MSTRSAFNANRSRHGGIGGIALGVGAAPPMYKGQRSEHSVAAYSGGLCKLNYFYYSMKAIAIVSYGSRGFNLYPIRAGLLFSYSLYGGGARPLPRLVSLPCKNLIGLYLHFEYL